MTKIRSQVNLTRLRQALSVAWAEGESLMVDTGQGWIAESLGSTRSSLSRGWPLGPIILILEFLFFLLTGRGF